MGLKNLLDETIAKCEEIGKGINDIAMVQWVDENLHDVKCTWKTFDDAVRHLEYDNGYGGQEINESLSVVFKDDTWLERAEYDGAEWWEYKKCPVDTNIECISIDKVKEAVLHHSDEYGALAARCMNNRNTVKIIPKPLENKYGLPEMFG